MKLCVKPPSHYFFLVRFNGCTILSGENCRNYSIDKFLNPESIKEINNPKKIDEFIKMGLRICDMESVNNSILEKLENYSIDISLYKKYLKKDKIRSKEVKINIEKSIINEINTFLYAYAGPYLLF